MTESELRLHYVELLWTDKAIADKFNLDNGSVARLRHKYGIQTIVKSIRAARLSGKREVTEELLREMYLVRRMTTGQIAEELGLGTSSITRFRQQWGIQTLEDRAESFVGTRFGRLVVLQEERFRGGKCLCRCDCGKGVRVARGNLQQGLQVSCGCFGTECRSLPLGQAMLNAAITEYRASAKKRGILWGLQEGQVRLIFGKNCHYCGSPPRRTRKTQTANGGFTYNGIDRVDSTKGYVSDNTVPCCTECNYAKGKLDVGDFLSHIRRIQSTPDLSLNNVGSLTDKETSWAFARYRSAAVYKGRDFTLTREEVQALVVNPCAYCNLFSQATAGKPQRVGIDRMDNARGYVQGNVVSCCWLCNQMKGRRSVQDFLALVQRVQAMSNSTR